MIEKLKAIPTAIWFSVFATPIVSVVGTFVAFQSLVAMNFTTLGDRMDDLIDNTAKSFAYFERRMDADAEVVNQFRDSSIRVEATISQMDDDLTFLREFVTEARQYKNGIGLGPSLIETRYERLPMGGLGQNIVPEFPTYTTELPFDTSEAEIEERATRLKQLLRRRLKSDRRFEFSDNLHEVVVLENVVEPLNAPTARLDLTALVIERNSNSE